MARAYAKLMAYKDEYEVARLYTDGRFAAQLASQFEGEARLTFHLAPPLLARRDLRTGRPLKRAYGGWLTHLMRQLAHLKRLRGTRFDPFGYSADRRLERQLIQDYETLSAELLAGLTPANHGLAVQLAALPERIRGFGHVKARHLAAVKDQEAALLASFRQPAERPLAAAE